MHSSELERKTSKGDGARDDVVEVGLDMDSKCKLNIWINVDVKVHSKNVFDDVSLSLHKIQYF